MQRLNLILVDGTYDLRILIIVVLFYLLKCLIINLLAFENLDMV
jgi:hypothetical protein